LEKRLGLFRGESEEESAEVKREKINALRSLQKEKREKGRKDSPCGGRGPKGRPRETGARKEGNRKGELSHYIQKKDEANVSERGPS